MDIPVLGVLSRTLIRSPIINWIIPARVRGEAHNDVIFIGEDFIHIKEILPDGHLQHVATKSDFGSRIRAARVFGEPRVPVMDARPYYPEFQKDMKIDITEATDPNNGLNAAACLPPQILVLTMDPPDLVFLFAQQDPNGCIIFVQSGTALSSHSSFLEQQGKHLAIDPRSRAIAVGACEESIILFSTKHMDHVREELVQNPSNWSLIIREKTIRIEGIIVKMEFLYPSAEDDDHVILLVLHFKGKRLKMTCLEWSHSKGPDSFSLRLNGCPIDIGEEELPVLLIPLQYSPSNILLVFPQRIYVFEKILSGAPEPQGQPIVSYQASRYPGSSRRLPMWTSWARVKRNWSLRQKVDENFYLAREDGEVQYIQLEDHSLWTHTPAGHFGCNIGTAFASLDVGFALDTPDVLVAAGDMCNGEVVKIGAWRSETNGRCRTQVLLPDFLETVPNWSPSVDILTTDFGNHKGRVTKNRPSLFATAGRAPYGAISELRRGHHAPISTIIKLEDQDLAGSTRLHILPSSACEENAIFVLVAFPYRSMLVRIANIASDPSASTDYDDSNCGLDLNSETLAASDFPSGHVVQITRNAIYILDPASETTTMDRKLALYIPSGQTIIMACLHPQTPAIITAVRAREEILLELGWMCEGGSTNSVDIMRSTNPYSLSSEPTAMAITSILDSWFVFLSTLDGMIEVLSMDPLRGLSLIVKHEIKTTSSSKYPAVCESIAILSSPSKAASAENTDFLFVGGLRNGSLYTVGFHCLKREDGLSGLYFRQADTILFDHTALRVFPDYLDHPDTCFVAPGSDLCCLKYSGGSPGGLDITNVWFTDRYQPGFSQSPFYGFARVPIQNYRKEFWGSLVCISGSDILIALMNDEISTVPRRLSVRGTPQRAVYSTNLKKLVLSSTHTFVPHAQDQPTFRVSRGLIQFIDSEIYSDKGTNRHLLATYELELRERVYAMTDWTFQKEDRKFNFLVVATGITQEDGSRNGRILFIQLKIDGQGTLTVREAKRMEMNEGPVYSLAMFDKVYMVFCYGNFLRVAKWSVTDSQWIQVCFYELTSPGLHVSVSPPYIYVSTTVDSLYIFELRSESDVQTARPTYTLVLVFSDEQARELLGHLTLSVPNDATPSISNRAFQSPSTNVDTFANIVLMSDKQCNLTAVLVPQIRTHKSALPRVFEVSLPRSMMRLQRGSISPPWRRCTIPGVLVDDIIGSAVDGTIMTFTLVQESAWRLCCLITNLLNASRSKGWPRAGIPSYASSRHGPSHYIDGDLLEIFLQDNGEVLFRQLLQAADDEVKEMFEKLTEETLPLLMKEGMEGDAITRVIFWLKLLLTPAL